MPATTIVKVSGDNQYGGVCNELTLPLRVRVTDGTTGVSGTIVTFAITNSIPADTDFQILSAESVTTDSNGIAETYLTLGKLKGVYTVTATVSGLSGSPITFTENAIAIVTLEEFKLYHGLTSETVDANDKTLASIVGTVTEMCEEELDQPICQRVVEEIVDGSGETKQFVKRGRIISLIEDATGSTLGSLQYRDDAISSWTNLLTNENYINLDPDNAFAIELLDSNAFTYGIKNIRINYNAGISPIPSNVKKMALEMCEIMFKESSYQGGTSRLGISTVNDSVGGSNRNIVYKELRAGRWDEIINKYRKIV